MIFSFDLVLIIIFLKQFGKRNVFELGISNRTFLTKLR